MEIKSRHGTMECFWENDRLMQFQANNTENKDGELKDVTDEGACYFTPPTSANLFVLQAVGAGGGGAVGLSGCPATHRQGIMCQEKFQLIPAF